MLLAHVVQLFGGLGCILTNVGTIFLHFSMAGDVFQLMSLKHVFVRQKGALWFVGSVLPNTKVRSGS